MGLSAVIDRLNAAHPWSHNDAYTGFVMAQARAVRRGGGDTAVDAGCGTGNLLSRLSEVFPTVIGIEPHAPTAASATRRFPAQKVRIENRAFRAEPPGAYDLITFVASLHHMPLHTALRDARAALRPGGRVVIVGVARATWRDAPRSGLSLLLNPLVGLVRHPRRANGQPAHMQAPATEATQSFEQIRTIANDILPGIRMRRRLFWRYTATWVAPR